jgi:hypothetical protein
VQCGESPWCSRCARPADDRGRVPKGAGGIIPGMGSSCKECPYTSTPHLCHMPARRMDEVVACTLSCQPQGDNCVRTFRASGIRSVAGDHLHRVQGQVSIQRVLGSRTTPAGGALLARCRRSRRVYHLLCCPIRGPSALMVYFRPVERSSDRRFLPCPPASSGERVGAPARTGYPTVTAGSTRRDTSERGLWYPRAAPPGLRRHIPGYIRSEGTHQA